MPRPKINPEDRVRGIQACTLCRSSKKRCNGETPCSNCHRRGLDDRCTFAPPAQGHVHHRGESRASNGFTDSPASGGHHGRIPMKITEKDSISTAGAETVYTGSSASAALLQFMKEVVNRNIGDSDFSQVAAENEGVTDTSEPSLPANGLHLDSDRIFEYVEGYCASTAGVLSMYAKDQLAILASNQFREIDSMETEAATDYAILAIGAQTSSSIQARADEKFCLSAVQKIAFAGMLENQNLNTVQIFLLLSFYMLVAGRRDAVFMYLGIAARAAHVIRLGKKEDFSDPEPEISFQRQRTLRSLVTLDIIVSSIHGRPSATDNHRPTPGSPSSMTAMHEIRDVALVASYELSEMVSRIVNELYGSRHFQPATADRYLQLLQVWLCDLPADLRLSEIPPISTAAASEQVVASLHVSAYYYHVVMLVTRPFMISHLIKKLAAHKTTIAGDQSTRVSEASDGETTMLAHACTNAAIYLAQTIYEVHQWGYILPKMPLVEAWTFAAALVLGFRMFAAADQDWEIEEAYKGAQVVLTTLATNSHQAAQNVEVLRSLYRAVIKQRQVLTSRNREKSGSMVGKVMDLTPRAPGANFENAGMEPLPATSPENGWLHDFTFLDDPSQALVDNSTLPWQNFSSQMWDNFLCEPALSG